VKPVILVVEDEVLIALDLVDHLETAGYGVAGPYLTVAHALEYLHSDAPCDGAVIDINLGQETAEPVARTLAAKAIPFVVLSGYAVSQQEAAFASAPRLHKPMRPKDLMSTLHKLIAAAPREPSEQPSAHSAFSPAPSKSPSR
jgi:CheY-like chemotaxis protein